MKSTRDPRILSRYLSRCPVSQWFSTPDLPFVLFQYEKGECIDQLRSPDDYIQIIVQGQARIYTLRADGSYSPLHRVGPFTVLGDVEFCGQPASSNRVEVTAPTACLALPLSLCRDKLEQDTLFLRFLLRSLSQKLTDFSTSESAFSTVEEKTLALLRQTPTHTLQNVEQTSFQLRCSSRQLLRALKTLREKGLVEKKGRGAYRLCGHP